MFEAIRLIYTLPQEYIAIRLQSTEFIIAISHLLPRNEENQALIPDLLKYVLLGFKDLQLTLSISSYCFHIMCKENAKFIAPFGLELA